MIKLFLLHFIADFLLQPRKMGKNKSSNYYWLFGHLCIQFFVFLLFTNFKLALLNTLIHGIIDKNIWNLYKLIVKYKIKGEMKAEGFGTKTNRPFYNNKEKYDNVFKIKSEYFKFWEDHWFYATIGLDQFLHAITLIYLSKYL